MQVLRSRSSTRSRVRAVAVLVALAAPVTVLPAAPGRADPRDERERVERVVAEAEAVLEHATEAARAAAGRYRTADAALPPARERVDLARGAVVAAEVSARTAGREARQARRDLSTAQRRYERTAGAVDRARERAAEFAVAAYKGGNLARVNLLLEARDPGQVLDRLGYLEQVSTAERETLDRLAGTRLDARQAGNEALRAADRAEAARLAAAAALAEAQAAAASAEAAADEVTGLVAERAAALEQAEAEREASLARYEQAEAEAARVAAEVRAWEEAQRAAGRSAPSPAGQRPAGSLTVPTKGWVSSPYGMRHDPFYKVHQLHAGIDIAAPGGAPVHAAADGTVILAAWTGGYGNYTGLGHGALRGRDLSTCYAHQSQLLVRPGERVRRGDLIGRVGTTGASTGTHLHFEVRLDGAPTDPVAFLPDL